jgi:hypothetical protein
MIYQLISIVSHLYVKFLGKELFHVFRERTAPTFSCSRFHVFSGYFKFSEEVIGIDRMFVVYG